MRSCEIFEAAPELGRRIACPTIAVVEQAVRLLRREAPFPSHLLSERRRRRSSGVTLIEMLVVVTIIALFAALVAPRMLKKSDTARVVAARAQINSFMTAIGAYKLDTGLFPSTEQGLNALRVKPADLNQWQGPYLPQDIPVDPWGRPYTYKFPGEHGDEPDIVSLGADGQPGGEGINADVLSWKSQ